MKEIVLRVDGKEIRALAEKVGGVQWFHYEGQTFSYDPRKSASKKRRGSAGEGSGDIGSPMPGKITKLLKSVGDTIHRGDAVIVMEAMKMEYTLKAEIDGKIEAINCKVGDQVTLGAALVRLVPEVKK